MGSFVENINKVAKIITSGVLDPNAEGYSNAVIASNMAAICTNIYDQFDDRYLGSKSIPPMVDNDGNSLVYGALFFDNVNNSMKVWSNAGWINAGSSVNGTTERHVYESTSGQTVFYANYESGYIDVFLNGSKLQNGVDFIANSSTYITLTTGATTGDIIDIICYSVFEISTAPKKSETAYTVATVENLVSVPSDYTTAIVKDVNRGGTFVWSAAGTANGGTVFAGATGYWNRQYSGELDIKWFGHGMDGNLDFYVSKTGSDTNNGFTALTPFLTIQKAIDTIKLFSIPENGITKITIGDGVYEESINIPNHLVNNNNYLKFVGSIQSMQQDPSTWAGVIIDGTLSDGTGATGCSIGMYNNVQFKYILFRNWYNTSLTNVQQVQVAVNIEAYANVYLYGCAGIGNGFNNIYVNPMGRAVVTGGIYDGARYSINNTGGRLSFSATSTAERSIIKNALEYGVHAKHQSSTVLDYTEFENNGQIPVAASYGSALFAYKSGASIDTRACVFNKNNIVYNARGGFIASNPDLPDIMGSGANLNDRIWLNKGYGQDDLINYRSLAGRDLTLSFGGGTTTGGTATLAYDSNAVIPKSYLMNTDQYIMIEIWGSNNAGGTAQCLPSLYDNTGVVRYQLGTFLVPDSGSFKIQLLVQASTGGLIASVFWNTIGASVGGTYVGQNIVNPINFATADLEFQVWGTTTSTNTLTIKKATCVLWG